MSAPATPRNDLVQVFLTGVPGLNQPASVKAAEMLRLNTTTPAVPAVSQNPLGVIGGDVAGFPNGRRPGDDVVDIALRAVEGILLSPDPASFPKLTDGASSTQRLAIHRRGLVTFRWTACSGHVPVSAGPDLRRRRRRIANPRRNSVPVTPA